MKVFRKSPPKRQRQRPPSPDEQTPKVFSSQARRPSHDQNDKPAVQRKTSKASGSQVMRFWLQRFGLIVLLLAVVASFSNGLSLSPHAEVRQLNAQGNSAFLHSQSTYQTAANKLLSGSIWSQNKVTINTAAISQQLINQFPELSSASVALPFIGHQPIVYIEAAHPALILDTANGSYIIGTNGKALLASSSLPAAGQQNLPKVTDQSGLKVSLNRQILTVDNVSFIQTVVAQLAARQATVSSMSLPPAASELDAQITGQPYYVRFNLQTDTARQQAGTFLATWSQLQKKHITPSRYIDVRLDGRAYYQ